MEDISEKDDDQDSEYVSEYRKQYKNTSCQTEIFNDQRNVHF